MLRARGLVVAHPGRAPGEPPACGPLDLDVAPGGWLTVCGGNGSGKTALLATLGGLAPPVAGAVAIEGRDPFAPATRRAARAQVGIVFQEPETQGLMDSVARELAFPLENLGWPRADIVARVEELLAAFDLAGLRAAAPGHLSGGEAQRVALAAAMAPRPRLLLLDEPASYLDPAGRASLLAALAELRGRDGTAVVWSACAAGEAPEAGPTLDLGGGREGAVRSGADRRPAAADRPAPGEILWQAEGLRLERRDERGTVELWGGLDLAIRAGERILLTGANGSGKTALLDLLAGLRERGLSGRWTGPLAGAPGGRGYLTQFPESQLFAETVADDVGFGLRGRPAAGTSAAPGARRSAAERAAQVDAALREVGLEPARVARRAPDALSLGEQRRVALAGVLVTRPRAVLLDEPTAGLDPVGRADLEAALDRVAAEGRTLVVASHDPGWAGRKDWRIFSLPAPRRTPGGAPGKTGSRP